MDNIIWKAITNKGLLITLFDNNKYNNFLNYDHSQWICFTLFNKSNNTNYGIDLIKGCFLINGLSIYPAIQNGVYDIPCIPKKKYNYGQKLFWYNLFLAELNTGNNENKCINVFTGYTVLLDLNVIKNKQEGKIVLARPCLKINTINNTVSFSTSYWFEYINLNGLKIKVLG